MALLAIAPLLETGHVLASLGFAKSLRAAGHEVVYWLAQDFREVAAAEGFEVVDLWGGALPLGWFAQHQRATLEFHGVRRRLAPYRWQAAAIAHSLRGDDDRVFERRRPDLCIVDHHHFVDAIASSRGIPVAHYSTTLAVVRSRDGDPDRPPTSMRLMPPRSQAGRAAMRLVWGGDSIRAALQSGLLAAFDLSWGKPLIAWRQLRTRADEMRRGLLRKGDPKGDVLVLCPSDFDFPGAVPRGVRYGDAALDRRRQEKTFDWANIDGDPRPLVYVSIGSQSHRVTFASALLRAIVEWAVAQRDAKVLVAAGDAVEALNHSTLPRHVSIVKSAPQLSALKRSSVFISHAGLNGTKEAIDNGVPMVCFPLDAEQPGNAARAAYHRVGITCSPRGVDARTVGALATGVGEDSAMRAAVAAMRRRFAQAEERQPNVGFVERCLWTLKCGD